MQSEQINELAAALAAAQGEFTPIKKTSNNPFFKSKYADLAEVRAATTPALSKHKLAVLQAPEIRDGALVMVSKLVHASGQWVDSTFPLGAKAKIQEMGSEITYVRRYCLSSLLGVASEDDDDGNSASDRKDPAPKNGTGNHQPPPTETHEKPPAPVIFHYDLTLGGFSEDKLDEAHVWLKGQKGVTKTGPMTYESNRRLPPLDKCLVKS